MGVYLNPGSTGYEEALRSPVFVDKTGMILYLNTLVNTPQKYLCVSRPRRFGKTMAAKMLSAYYDRDADSRELFEKLKVAAPSENKAPWDVYLGSFDVIRITVTDFIRHGMTIAQMLERMQKLVDRDIASQYPDADYFDTADLPQTMADVYRWNRHQFVVIIDEWDAPFREFSDDKEGQKTYLDFLRSWLKDREYVALVYMTGILPIKKYGMHSALNMFWEFSMTEPQQLARYAGFTAEEVRQECRKRGLAFEAFQEWYDGYRLSGIEPEAPAGNEQIHEKEYDVYSPYSVVKAILSGQIANYWNQTETYEALRQYIDWNFGGLKEDVAVLMNGGRIRIDITGYQNDMTTFHNKDDILTLLVHLGYLGYDRQKREVFIPNREVQDVFRVSTRSRDWSVTFNALRNSRRLLEATWAGDEAAVAALLEAAHDKAGNRTYHSEAALSYAVRLAYYAAQDLYTVIPEMDTGKGYADLIFLPKSPDHPAMLIELKYERDADSAIAQIHRQKYPERLGHYRGNLILVGISYDRSVSNDGVDFKHHSCRIERA